MSESLRYRKKLIVYRRDAGFTTLTVPNLSARGISLPAAGAALARAARADVPDPDIAAMMARMMTAVVAHGSGRAVAGKTGTTQDYHDAWFIGGTGGMVVGIWLGNDDDKPMNGVTGGSLPARLFHDIAGEIRGEGAGLSSPDCPPACREATPGPT
jgi:penicillin-binding protein 1A